MLLHLVNLIPATPRAVGPSFAQPFLYQNLKHYIYIIIQYNTSIFEFEYQMYSCVLIAIVMYTPVARSPC